MRRQLSAGLVVGALASCAMAFAGSAPAPVLIGLALLAGAAPAACPGGIRALLTRLVADGAVPRALSAEATLTQLTWTAAPALVVLLGLQVHAGAPLALGALLAATASYVLLRLPESQDPARAGPAVPPLPRTEPAAHGRQRAGRAAARTPSPWHDETALRTSSGTGRSRRRSADGPLSPTRAASGVEAARCACQGAARGRVRVLAASRP
ncbi:hypothetical protein [Streptomyces spectabilis]|uniref:MFS transporter n=1 Tax=Streptomyces spectabilis TaxID=68270 RepID=A0A516R0S6_STRST|nr:hypothetical protein [Streptomyces spectabilis]QDQ09252.1 hypothetical protein FH965_00630 [Streptomyces spectabilis]